MKPKRITVDELIGMLQVYDKDLPVVLSTKKGIFKFLQKLEPKHDDSAKTKDVLALTCDIDEAED